MLRLFFKEKTPEELALEEAVAEAKKLIDQAVPLCFTQTPQERRKILEADLSLRASFGTEQVVAFNKSLVNYIKSKNEELETQRRIKQKAEDKRKKEEKKKEKKKEYDQKIKTLSEEISAGSDTNEDLEGRIADLIKEHSTLETEYKNKLRKLAEDQQKTVGEFVKSLPKNPPSFVKVNKKISDEYSTFRNIKDTITQPVPRDSLSYAAAWLTCILEKKRQVLRDQMPRETGLWLDEAMDAAANAQEEEKATEQQRPALPNSTETLPAPVLVHLETTGSPSVSGNWGTQTQQTPLPVQPRVEAVVPRLTLGASRIN